MCGVIVKHDGKNHRSVKPMLQNHLRRVLHSYMSSSPRQQRLATRTNRTTSDKPSARGSRYSLRIVSLMSAHPAPDVWTLAHPPPTRTDRSPSSLPSERYLIEQLLPRSGLSTPRIHRPGHSPRTLCEKHRVGKWRTKPFLSVFSRSDISVDRPID
jgi:hypothetical protein